MQARLHKLSSPHIILPAIPPREHHDWVAKRGSELAADENSTFQAKCLQERKRAESEIDLVRLKLKEEKAAKVELMVHAAEDKNKARRYILTYNIYSVNVKG